MTAEPEEMEIQVRRERAQEQTLRGLEWETMCGDWPGLVSVARFVPKISFYLRFPLNFRPLYHPWLPFGGVCFLKKLYDLSVCGCTCTWPQGHVEVRGQLREWVLSGHGARQQAPYPLASSPALLLGPGFVGAKLHSASLLFSQDDDFFPFFSLPPCT